MPDLEDLNDLEPEQFIEEQDEKPSKEVYKQLREQRKREQLQEKHNKEQAKKHRATFHRVNNVNCYKCDNCGKVFEHDKEGSLIYKNTGEYAYCGECLKKLYPNYRRIRLAGSISKTDALSNHWDIAYFSGLH